MNIGELLSQYGGKYAIALLTTWKLTAVSFALALVLGVLITAMRVSPIHPLRIIAGLYVQIFRNIPGVALLIFLVYALPYLNLIFSLSDLCADCDHPDSGFLLFRIPDVRHEHDR
ncbi:MAG: ABC transporter permease subunit [Lachnospiraceae bacterium]|nr:ABC transporter permease subunit [Lachnospiraceae bacterium]